jgi:hypothetical protein
MEGRRKKTEEGRDEEKWTSRAEEDSIVRLKLALH